MSGGDPCPHGQWPADCHLCNACLPKVYYTHETSEELRAEVERFRILVREARRERDASNAALRDGDARWAARVKILEGRLETIARAARGEEQHNDV